MAADLIARGLAARALATPGTPGSPGGNVEAIGTFTALGSLTVPAGASRVSTVGYSAAGKGAGTYVADSLATAALAAAHPRFCKADAAGRHFRLLPSPDGAIGFSQGGFVGGAGINSQPAIQAAVKYAAAVSIAKVVNDLGAIDCEMWEPVLDDPNGSGLPWYHRNRTLQIPPCEALDLDFAGARIALKGPSGGERFPGQVSPSAGGRWLGGFVTVTGLLDRLRLANVDVDGGFSGDTVNQSDGNLYDKGFLCQDLFGFGTIVMENVTLHGFAGEIMYDNSSALHISRDCHFYNSGHSCWNPSGVGRVVAYNLQAGIARQPAEVLTGKGHVYYGGRFYKGGTAGCTFVGGPDPEFLGGGYPYNWPTRRDDELPPFTWFHGTRFEQITGNYVYLGSWMRGSITLVDSTLDIAPAFASAGSIQDIDLDVLALADQTGVNEAVRIVGPASPSEATGAPGGELVRKPANINIRLTCGATQLGQAENRAVNVGIGLYNLLDRSCVFRVGGIANTPWRVAGDQPSGFLLPRIDVSGFVASPGSTIYGGTYDHLSSDRSYRVQWPVLLASPTAAGTFNIGLDMSYGYVEGQRVRFVHAGGGSSDRILSFARDAAGLMLSTDRTLRRAGEYLELEYSSAAGKWVEAAYTGAETTAATGGGGGTSQLTATPFAYAPGWADQAPSNHGGHYWKNGNQVFVAGCVSGNASGTGLITTLPPGFRPAKGLACYMGTILLAIGSDGTIVNLSGNSGPVFLSGITFLAA